MSRRAMALDVVGALIGLGILAALFCAPVLIGHGYDAGIAASAAHLTGEGWR